MVAARDDIATNKRFNGDKNNIMYTNFEQYTLQSKYDDKYHLLIDVLELLLIELL